MESFVGKLEFKEKSAIWDSSKDSTEGSGQGELLCLEASQGAIGQNPCLRGLGEAPILWEQHLPPRNLSSVNLEVLTEKFGTFGFQGRLN